jgi:hypothetical protein
MGRPYDATMRDTMRPRLSRRVLTESLLHASGEKG